MIDIRALLISFCCGLHTCLTTLAFLTYLPTYIPTSLHVLHYKPLLMQFGNVIFVPSLPYPPPQQQQLSMYLHSLLLAYLLLLCKLSLK